MNYRMYTDNDMNEANLSMVEDISMEDDIEMPVMKGVHKHEMPTYDTMAAQDIESMFGTMPMEDMMPMNGNMTMGNMYDNEDLDYMDNMDNMNDMGNMDNRMPMNEEGNMYNMENIIPCCMMNNMGAMPYMVELEEDEDDEKCDDDVDDIVKKIEKHHPEILTVLSAYGIPYPISNKIVKRIVRLTLKHK